MALKLCSELQEDFIGVKRRIIVGLFFSGPPYHAGFVWAIGYFFLEFKHKLGPEVAACQVDVLL